MRRRARAPGDDYFDHIGDRIAALVVENRSGASMCFVIVDEAEVVGRVNISNLDRPELTELGFRVAEHAQGRGIATYGVRAALDNAARRGVQRVRARVSTANPGSRRVLERCRFESVGPAEVPDGTSGSFGEYRADLTDTPRATSV